MLHVYFYNLCQNFWDENFHSVTLNDSIDVVILSLRNFFMYEIGSMIIYKIFTVTVVNSKNYKISYRKVTVFYGIYIFTFLLLTFFLYNLLYIIHNILHNILQKNYIIKLKILYNI